MQHIQFKIMEAIRKLNKAFVFNIDVKEIDPYFDLPEDIEYAAVQLTQLIKERKIQLENGDVIGVYSSIYKMFHFYWLDDSAQLPQDAILDLSKFSLDRWNPALGLTSIGSGYIEYFDLTPINFRYDTSDMKLPLSYEEASNVLVDFGNYPKCISDNIASYLSSDLISNEEVSDVLVDFGNHPKYISDTIASYINYNLKRIIQTCNVAIWFDEKREYFIAFFGDENKQGSLYEEFIMKTRKCERTFENFGSSDSHITTFASRIPEDDVPMCYCYTYLTEEELELRDFILGVVEEYLGHACSTCVFHCGKLPSN